MLQATYRNAYSPAIIQRFNLCLCIVCGSVIVVSVFFFGSFCSVSHIKEHITSHNSSVYFLRVRLLSQAHYFTVMIIYSKTSNKYHFPHFLVCEIFK